MSLRVILYCVNLTAPHNEFIMHLMTTPHTPLPWKLFRRTRTTLDVEGPNREFIARFRLTKARPQTEANARLCAASPELLAECDAQADIVEALATDLASKNDFKRVVERLLSSVRRARRLITKARGQ